MVSGPRASSMANQVLLFNVSENVSEVDLRNLICILCVPSHLTPVLILPRCVTGSQGRVSVNGMAVLEADVETRNGQLYSLDGVLIPASILPILPHRCDVSETRLVEVGLCRLQRLCGCTEHLRCSLSFSFSSSVHSSYPAPVLFTLVLQCCSLSFSFSSTVHSSYPALVLFTLVHQFCSLRSPAPVLFTPVLRLQFYSLHSPAPVLFTLVPACYTRSKMGFQLHRAVPFTDRRGTNMAFHDTDQPCPPPLCVSLQGKCGSCSRPSLLQCPSGDNLVRSQPGRGFIF